MAPPLQRVKDIPAQVLDKAATSATAELVRRHHEEYLRILNAEHERVALLASRLG